MLPLLLFLPLVSLLSELTSGVSPVICLGEIVRYSLASGQAVLKEERATLGRWFVGCGRWRGLCIRRTALGITIKALHRCTVLWGILLHVLSNVLRTFPGVLEYWAVHKSLFVLVGHAGVLASIKGRAGWWCGHPSILASSISPILPRSLSPADPQTQERGNSIGLKPPHHCWQNCASETYILNATCWCYQLWIPTYVVS